jgi:cytochrome oxidase Cu insertion factor (SCO1/SenC/PrrC family)
VVNALLLALGMTAAAFVPLLEPGDAVPALPLVDQSGHAFSLDAMRGDAVVLTFIYTRCSDPAMCPLASSKFARLQTLIGNARVRLLEITLDPAFDTPRVLRSYGAAFGEDPKRWTLATGAAGSINELAERLGIATQWTRPGTLVHTESAIVLDPQGRIAQTIDGNAWQPNDVLAAALDATGMRSSPLARAVLRLTDAIEACGGGRVPFTAIEILIFLATISAVVTIVLFRSLRLMR